MLQLSKCFALMGSAHPYIRNWSFGQERGTGGTVAEQNWAGGSTAPGRGCVSPLLKVLPAFAEGFNPLQIYDGNKMLSSRHFQRKH